MQALVVPKYDKRQYRTLKLENELEAILIHDASVAQKSAVALSIKTGFWDDPEATPGLAHMCEHMILVGSRKYPKENGFLEFLSARGGNRNACTSDITTFTFDVLSKHLEEALDVFANLFLDPTFPEAAVQREVQTIHSEHVAMLDPNLDYLDHRALGLLASKTHPMSKFPTGCVDTLGARPNLRDEVVSFWKQHYSANIMKLVVVSDHSLDALESVVRSTFSAIENRHTVPVVCEEPVYPAQSLSSCISVEADREMFILTWPMPNTLDCFRVKPGKFLCHVLGGSHPRSLWSYLGTNRLTNFFAVRCTEQLPYPLFKLYLGLTPTGYRNLNRIIDAVYAYIALVRRECISKAMYDEVSWISDAKFQFEQSDNLSSNATEIAQAMQRYPLEYSLFGDLVADQFDCRLINTCFDALHPNNMMTVLMTPSFDFRDDESYTLTAAPHADLDLEDPFFELSYRIDKIDASLLQRWETMLTTSPTTWTSDDALDVYHSLRSPTLNPFVGGDFAVLPPPKEHKDSWAAPDLVVDRDIMRVWHKQDQTFHTPHAVFFVNLYSAVEIDSAKAAVMTKMVTMFLLDAMSDYGQKAHLAGLDDDIIPSEHGISVRVSGYNSKQIDFIETLLTRSKTLELRERKFEQVRAHLARFYRSCSQPAAATPICAQEQLQSCTLKRAYETTCLADEIRNLKFNDVALWWSQLLATRFVEVVAMGNVSLEQTLQLAEAVERVLEPTPGDRLQNAQCIKLNTPSEYWIQSQSQSEEGSILLNNFQIGPATPESRAILEILSQILEYEVYRALRVDARLGYVLSSEHYSVYSVDHWEIIVQSDTFNPSELDTRVEAWMVTVPDVIRHLPAAEFEEHRKSQIVKTRSSFTSIVSEADHYVRLISSHAHGFDFEGEVARALESVTPDDVIQFWNTYIAVGGAKRAKISSQIWPSDVDLVKPSSLNVQVVQSASEFKAQMPCFVNALQ